MSEHPVPAWVIEATAPFSDNPELQLAAQQELLGLADGGEERASLERGFSRSNGFSVGRRKANLAERHWIAKDEAFRTSAENLGMNRFEVDAARAVREHLWEDLQAGR